MSEHQKARSLGKPRHADVESARVPAAQLALLQPYRVHHVLERHGQAQEVARHLRYQGLLSFDPDGVSWLTPAQEAELDFLCGVARRIGLRGTEGVLEGLTPPYAYRLSELTYDFTAGGWCLRNAPDSREESASQFAEGSRSPEIHRIAC